MQFRQNSEPLIAFLLVNKADPLEPVEGASPDVWLSAGGGTFVQAANPVEEIGGGWYKITLSADETGTLGPLILRAQADGTAEWRDIHQVVAGAEGSVDISAVVEEVKAQLLGQPLALHLPVTLKADERQSEPTG